LTRPGLASQVPMARLPLQWDVLADASIGHVGGPTRVLRIESLRWQQRSTAAVLHATAECIRSLVADCTRLGRLTHCPRLKRVVLSFGQVQHRQCSTTKPAIRHPTLRQCCLNGWLTEASLVPVALRESTAPRVHVALRLFRKVWACYCYSSLVLLYTRHYPSSIRRHYVVSLVPTHYAGCTQVLGHNGGPEQLEPQASKT
jgi:hypothetical protein